jgi:hypothetical protein
MSLQSKGDSKSGSKSRASRDAMQRKPKPFEPRSQKSAEKKPTDKKSAASAARQKSTVATKSKQTAPSSGIPEVVSRRMIKRIALFCGIPSLLGMSTFVTSYLLVSNDIANVPTYAVLLVSLAWFGLGVLGVSYGALSASWDETTPGSRLGWAEFRTNLGRMTGAWRSTKKQEKE